MRKSDVSSWTLTAISGLAMIAHLSDAIGAGQIGFAMLGAVVFPVGVIHGLSIMIGVV